MRTSAIFSTRARLLALLLLTPTRGHHTAGIPAASVPAHPAVLAASVEFGQKKIRAAYGNGPISFEANMGQTSAQVEFLSRGSGYSLFLASAEAVLAMKPLERAAGEQSLTGHASPAAETIEAPPAVMRMKLVGSQPAAEVEGLDPLPGKANYFIGNDPKKWRTDVPTYARVRYKDVYAGVDVVYHGNQDQLEYDFVLAPGADPSAIRISFPGAEDIHLDPNGDLVMRVGDGTMRQHKPFVYQDVGTIRRKVDAEYVVREHGEIAFKVANHDPHSSLVIDPVLVYSTFLGGSLRDPFGGPDVAVDASGSAYVTGTTLSTDFPTTPGAFQEGNRTPGHYGFVTRFDASGSIVYSTYLGGSSGANYPSGIAVDHFGNAYVAGGTTDSDFPTTPGAFQPECWLPPGPEPVAGLCRAAAAFVTKLNSTGSSLVYSTYLGGIAPATGIGAGGVGIAIDDSLNAFIVGGTGPGFPVTPGALQSIHADDPLALASFDGFVAKLNATGSALVYATYLGGRLDDLFAGIAIDRSGAAYVTGTTRSENFPTTPGAFQRNCPIVEQVLGCSIAFVSKINSTGTSLVYSTFLGGSGPSIAALRGVSSQAGGIAVDSSGHAYVAGSAYTTDFPTTPGTFKSTTTSRDAFVTKLTLDGSGLLYSTYLGGNAEFEEGNGIAIDSAGNAYVTGSTGSTDFPTLNAVQSVYGGDSRDAFVAKLDAAGVELTHSTFLGGQGYDQGLGIAVDAAGSAYVAGATLSADFPTANPAQAIYGGSEDAFVTKLGEEPSCPEDVTDQLHILRSRFYRIPFTPLRVQWVVIRNDGNDPIQGPLAFVMEDLQNAVFLGSRLKTVCFSPSGDPFVVVHAGGDDVLSPDERALSFLLFWKTHRGRIAYTPRVLSGIPTQ